MALHLYLVDLLSFTRLSSLQARLRRFVASLAFRRMFSLCGMALKRPIMVAELCANHPTTLGVALNIILAGLGEKTISFQPRTGTGEGESYGNDSANIAVPCDKSSASCAAPMKQTVRQG